MRQAADRFEATNQKNNATPHAQKSEALLEALGASPLGLDPQDAAARLARFGPNTLPKAEPPGLIYVFLRQFYSPLIYVLLAAALLSIAIEEWSDAGFISAVLLINAVIGTIQEFSAQRAATALQALVTSRCRVVRAGDTYEIDAEAIVPGDIILLESGDRIPADLRLSDTQDFEVDESLLTGESHTVLKDAHVLLTEDTFLGERRNMAFAGTLVSRGRARGLVVATALSSELGRIASAVLGKAPAKAPLLQRMEVFTQRVAILVGLAALVMAVVAFARGTPPAEIFLIAVALAVSAIPEGLPVALTVALAIGMRRMARRNVIIRRLVAVEALGSCTYIATDKTGTLTVNQLTARRIVLPDETTWKVTGEGTNVQGEIVPRTSSSSEAELALLRHLCECGVLCNEAFLGHRDHGWTHHGDAVDVALLVMAHKLGLVKAEIENRFPQQAEIPFESERLFSATLNTVAGAQQAHVKGALKRLLPMCDRMATPEGDLPLDLKGMEGAAAVLAKQGFRVLPWPRGKSTWRRERCFPRCTWTY